jgi:UDP-N-acetylmuramoyl-L-alanyl-D-glutamate--2,6-diaminopimelate ligase
MKIGELIEGLAVERVSGSPQTSVGGVTEDSRRVKPGDLFVARRGTACDGARFAAAAAQAGAAAVLADGPLALLPGVVTLTPAVPGTDLGRLAAHLAERFHRHPSRRLALVGVTGTNGKTTTAHLIHQILNRDGVRCGMIGTVCVDDGRNTAPAELTTPGGPEISALLARMVDAGCGAAVMEVSSHALDQGRVAALHFRGAVFTNLTGDHLDYHGTMEAYRAAKATLFRMLAPSGWAVVNGDDPAADSMIAGCSARVVRTALAAPHGADFAARIEARGINGSSLVVHHPGGAAALRLPLAGDHNVSNALQALAACAALGVPVARGIALLARCAAPPGRLELVTEPEAPFAVVVDYAHTDDALRNVLRALRPLVRPPARLHVVFGCGGDRDRTKRPRMAAVACAMADRVTITSDNPRTEDAIGIIDEVWAGVPESRRGDVERIPDRAAAIERAVADCRLGDVLIIAGKGHEDYQIIGREKRPFDDRLVARRAVWAATIRGGIETAPSLRQAPCASPEACIT